MTDAEMFELFERFARINQLMADHDRKRQELRLAPWQIGLTMLGGAAAVFAAGAAFAKLVMS